MTSETESLTPVAKPIPGELYTTNSDPRFVITFMEFNTQVVLQDWGHLRSTGIGFNYLPGSIMFLRWLKIPSQSYGDRILPERLAECLVGERKMLLCQYYAGHAFSNTPIPDHWDELQLFPIDKDDLDD